MTTDEITRQLEGIVGSDEFVARTGELASVWSSVGSGVEVVEPVLRFMEQHPVADFRMPGPVVHFVERFCGKGYEERLVQFPGAEADGAHGLDVKSSHQRN